MADAKLRRNLDTVFDPGHDFPSATLLTRTHAILDGRARSRYRRSHPIAIVAIIGFLFLAAAGLLNLHLWILANPSSPPPSNHLVPSGSRSGPWGFGGIAMVTPTIGWDNGVPFTRTTDGGLHWTDVTPLGVGQGFDDYYLDETHAWITDYSGVEPAQVVTFRTEDGGRTWQRGGPIQINAALGQTQQYYVDPAHGWLLLSSTKHASASTIYSDSLYITEDGGLHWHLLAVNSAPTSWRPGKFYCYQWCRMAFVSVSTGWIVGSQNEPTFVATHDGGATWQPWTIPFRGTKLTCPCSAGLPIFRDQDHGWLMLRGQPRGYETAFLVTADRGATWTPRSLPSAAPMSVGFYDADHGWAIADPPATSPPSPPVPTIALDLYRTANGGRTWTRVATTLQLQSKDGLVNGLYFLNDAIGFAVRAPIAAQLWELLRTTDGGHSWTVVATHL